MPLDAEEAEFMRANEAGEYVNSWPERAAYISAIFEAMRQQRKITISLRPKADSIAVIKDFAKKKKIPYQSLINAHIDMIAEEIKEMH